MRPRPCPPLRRQHTALAGKPNVVPLPGVRTHVQAASTAQRTSQSDAAATKYRFRRPSDVAAALHGTPRQSFCEKPSKPREPPPIQRQHHRH